MILYHGSRVQVSSPDILHSRSTVDFGRGFYATPLRDQALSWCERFRRFGDDAWLNSYTFDESAATTFNILRFDSYTREWLEFISACRMGCDMGDYDIVIGGVANDKVFNTCELYFNGYITAEAALDKLRFEKPNSQYCFRSQEAIDGCLAFRGAEQL